MIAKAPFLILFLCLQMVFVSGCASFGKKMKSFFAGEHKKPEVAKETDSPMDAFDREAMGQVPQRRYGRTTRSTLENEANLNPRAGSLWRTEGQGAYLFSENNFRILGDLLNVRLDGAPKDQLTSKAQIIRELTKKLERRGLASTTTPGEDANAASAPASTEGAAKTAKNDGKPADGKTNDPAGVNTDEIDAHGDQKPMPVEVVPTRVVERLGDGNYRVEGSQSFMIGKREYKVLVAGIVRAQDFNDESILSTRLMDPKFDVVATKKPSSGPFK